MILISYYIGTLFDDDFIGRTISASLFFVGFGVLIYKYYSRKTREQNDDLVVTNLEKRIILIINILLCLVTIVTVVLIEYFQFDSFLKELILILVSSLIIITILVVGNVLKSKLNKRATD